MKLFFSAPKEKNFSKALVSNDVNNLLLNGQFSKALMSNDASNLPLNGQVV